MNLDQRISELIINEVAVDAVADFLLKNEKFVRFDTPEMYDGYIIAREHLKAKIKEIIGR